MWEHISDLLLLLSSYNSTLWVVFHLDQNGWSVYTVKAWSPSAEFIWHNVKPDHIGKTGRVKTQKGKALKKDLTIVKITSSSELQMVKMNTSTRSDSLFFVCLVCLYNPYLVGSVGICLYAMKWPEITSVYLNYIHSVAWKVFIFVLGRSVLQGRVGCCSCFDSSSDSSKSLMSSMIFNVFWHVMSYVHEKFKALLWHYTQWF